MRTVIAAGGLLSACLGFAPSAAAQTPDSQPTSRPADSPAETTSTGDSHAETTRMPGPFIRFDDLSFDLGFEGRYDRRTVRQERRSGYLRIGDYYQRNREFGFEETIGLETGGSIVGRQFMRFDAAGRWGISQDWYKESRPGLERDRNPHGETLEYDVNLTFLPQGMITADAYAQRLDSRVPRAFLPSLDRTRERYGVDVSLNRRTTPMRFSFEHVWDDMTSRTRTYDDDEQRGSDKFRYETAWHIDERQTMRLEYEYEDRREQYSGMNTRFETTRNYVTLNHSLRFGQDAKSVWETLARFQDETGDLARDTAEASSLLKFQHTDAFASSYKAQFLRESFGGLTTRTWRGEAGLTHQIGESLVNSLQFYGLQQNADENADFTEWGGMLSSSFNRKNRWGDFSANLTYNHVGFDTADGARRGVVIAEAVTLRDPLPAILAHPDVDSITLVVTDANRTRTYLPVRDYVAVKVGRYMSLRRVPSGQIADKQTVLVSYTYNVASDYDVARDRVDLRVRQKFECGLTPYYAGSIQSEDVDTSRIARAASRDVNRHRLGATYTKKRWSCGLEYEYNDDSIDPYQAVRTNADAVLWRNARTQIGGQGSFAYYWFDGARDLAARDTALLDLGLSYRFTPARDCEINAAALYRYEDDTYYGVTNGVDLSGAVEWKIGFFSLRFEAEYDLLDLPGSDDRGFSVWLKLRRGIPVLARRD